VLFIPLNRCSNLPGSNKYLAPSGNYLHLSINFLEIVSFSSASLKLGHEFTFCLIVSLYLSLYFGLPSGSICAGITFCWRSGDYKRLQDSS
jgi:hypothetical protein